jgi:hypothetical protein
MGWDGIAMATAYAAAPMYSCSCSCSRSCNFSSSHPLEEGLAGGRDHRANLTDNRATSPHAL